MNVYKVLELQFGATQEHIVEAMDIVSAVAMTGVQAMNVVRVELIGSSAKVDPMDLLGVRSA